MTLQPDVGILRKLGLIVLFSGVLSIALGSWAFAKLFHFEAVNSILPGQIVIEANAAICFVLIGLSLSLAGKERPAILCGDWSRGLPPPLPASWACFPC